MRVLGIESSCDETAAAIVNEEGLVYSDIVESQIKIHQPYGGIIPELAARDHLRQIIPVVDTALRVANLSLGELDGIAVTTQPGLAGALLVGAQAAKTLAWSQDLPFVGVDHLVGHLLAVFLKRNAEPATIPSFPYIALLASGGHTAIYRVNGPLAQHMIELGATRDDAAGEAFDKVAKLLGLGYPGGPVIDRLAHQGNPKAFPIPIPMLHRDSYEFSFSGIKSWVSRHIASVGKPNTEQGLFDLCASFQYAVVEVLAKKTVRAAIAEKVNTIVLGGGVAANKQLRTRCAELCHKAELHLAIPPFSSCTDNAAMIAYAGAMRLAVGEQDELSIRTKTKTLLPRVTRKGRGARS